MRCSFCVEGNCKLHIEAPSHPFSTWTESSLGPPYSNIVYPGSYGISELGVDSSKYLTSCSFASCVGFALVCVHNGHRLGVLCHFGGHNNDVPKTMTEILEKLQRACGAESIPQEALACLISYGTSPGESTRQTIRALAKWAAEKCASPVTTVYQYSETYFDFVAGVMYPRQPKDLAQSILADLKHFKLAKLGSSIFVDAKEKTLHENRERHPALKVPPALSTSEPAKGKPVMTAMDPMDQKSLSEMLNASSGGKKVWNEL